LTRRKTRAQHLLHRASSPTIHTTLYRDTTRCLPRAYLRGRTDASVTEQTVRACCACRCGRRSRLPLHLLSPRTAATRTRTTTLPLQWLRHAHHTTTPRASLLRHSISPRWITLLAPASSVLLSCSSMRYLLSTAFPLHMVYDFHINNRIIELCRSTDGTSVGHYVDGRSHSYLSLHRTFAQPYTATLPYRVRGDVSPAVVSITFVCGWTHTFLHHQPLYPVLHTQLFHCFMPLPTLHCTLHHHCAHHILHLPHLTPCGCPLFGAGLVRPPPGDARIPFYWFTHYTLRTSGLFIWMFALLRPRWPYYTPHL